MHKFAREAYELGVHYIGGCCGFQVHVLKSSSIGKNIVLYIFLTDFTFHPALPHPRMRRGACGGARALSGREREAHPVGGRAEDAHQALGAGAGQQAVLGAAAARRGAALLPRHVPPRQLGRHQGGRHPQAADGGDQAGGHRPAPGSRLQMRGS